MSRMRLCFPLPAICLVMSLLAGCSSVKRLPASNSLTTLPSQVSGNWSFPISQGGNPTNGVTLNAGLNSSGTQVSGVAHVADSSCVDANANIQVAGSLGSNNQLALTSQDFNGITLTLTGQLSANGNALSNVKYNFSGGACKRHLAKG